MPRPKRVQYEGAVYHVTARGNERRNIVGDDSDRWLFIRTLEEMLADHEVLCHAWVLMDNHYHLLLETPLGNLSSAMKQLNGYYTQKFNRKHHRVGHLFQGRYGSIVVDKEIYLKELCRYVVLNPVRARMVKHPKDYNWSSYRATAGYSKKESWLEVKWLLAQFGKRLKQARKSYRNYVHEGIPKAEAVWQKKANPIYLGSEKFLEKMEELVGKDESLDIPKYQKKILRSAPEKVMEKVSRIYGVDIKEILRPHCRGNEARDVTMYLLRKEAGLSLKMIGNRLGITFTAVGKRCLEVKRRIPKDRVLAKKLSTLNSWPDPNV